MDLEELNFISPYLVTIIIAWLGAHTIKYVVSYIKKERRGFRSQLFVSGGMPSSHSATVVSMTTVIGLKDGLGSGLFGLASLFALIVMYDAMKVRRSSGEQGVAIVELIKEQKSSVKLPSIAKGHTPLEVTLGALLGMAIGAIVFFSTK
jgi:acid phosphatase family membrane protein YuiD